MLEKSLVNKNHKSPILLKNNTFMKQDKSNCFNKEYDENTDFLPNSKTNYTSNRQASVNNIHNNQEDDYIVEDIQDFDDGNLNKKNERNTNFNFLNKAGTIDFTDDISKSNLGQGLFSVNIDKEEYKKLLQIK